MKQFIYNASVYGVLRPLAKPVHAGLIFLVLLWERMMDALFAMKRDQSSIEENLTVVIKTFERPNILKRLLKSIRRAYPNMRVIVVDDSQKPTRLKGVETIVMPYDSGVSAGRNEALKHIKTKYMMLLDDDFIFNRHTKIQTVLKTLESTPQIDIVGGEVAYLPFYRKIDYKQARLHPSKAVSLIEPGEEIDGMRVYDKVANFYIARTESIQKVGWDNRIKRLDHADFFTRAKGVLVTVFNPSFKVLHARTPFNKAYMRKRLDLKADKNLLWHKYYLPY